MNTDSLVALMVVGSLIAEAPPLKPSKVRIQKETLTYLREEAIALFKQHHPKVYRAWEKEIRGRGLGSHKFRHFRSYTFEVVQPSGEWVDGNGNVVTRAFPGSITFTTTMGSATFKKSNTYTVALEPRYM